jgi:hypothetical protein
LVQLEVKIQVLVDLAARCWDRNLERMGIESVHFVKHETLKCKSDEKPAATNRVRSLG